MVLHKKPKGTRAFYNRDLLQQGPATKDDLLRMLDDGTLATTELAWNKEMDDWKPIQEIGILLKKYPNIEETSTQPPHDSTVVITTIGTSTLIL